jgi:peptidoglycan/LPS O-acetylase OafA/YrhL
LRITHTPPTMSHSSSEGRIPSLDGLRAISIGFVLVAHLAGTRGFPVSAALGKMVEFGDLGVHVFFVISGYLITRLLLEELERRQEIRLGRFYLRRTLRIFPPYYVLILALAIAQSLGWLQLAAHDVVRAISYTSNYYPDRSWFTGHTWSLSVEEQFYLLWPAVIVVAGPRRAIVAAACVVLLGPVVRTASWELMPWSGEGIPNRFETVADSIAAGCVLAGIRGWLHDRPLYMRALTSPFFAIVPLAVVAAGALHEHPLLYFAVEMSVMNVGAALCLDWCITYPEGRIGSLLNARPLVFVGLLSYSIYLWQQLFLNRASAAAINAFPVNILIAAAAALTSYYVIEQPSLRLRRRIERALDHRRAPIPPVAADAALLVPEPAMSEPRS